MKSLPEGFGGRSVLDPDPEVPAKARRRRYSAAYKKRILEEADQCSAPGEIGSLLRREGLYSSLLSRWRQQRASGAAAALEPKKRGRKARPVDPQAKRIAELERETARLRKKLAQAETIISVQKNSPSYCRKTRNWADGGGEVVGGGSWYPAGVLGSRNSPSHVLSAP